MVNATNFQFVCWHDDWHLASRRVWEKEAKQKTGFALYNWCCFSSPTAASSSLTELPKLVFLLDRKHNLSEDETSQPRNRTWPRMAGKSSCQFASREKTSGDFGDKKDGENAMAGCLALPRFDLHWSYYAFGRWHRDQYSKTVLEGCQTNKGWHRGSHRNEGAGTHHGRGLRLPIKVCTQIQSSKVSCSTTSVPELERPLPGSRSSKPLTFRWLPWPRAFQVACILWKRGLRKLNMPSAKVPKKLILSSIERWHSK